MTSKKMNLQYSDNGKFTAVELRDMLEKLFPDPDKTWFRSLPPAMKKKVVRRYKALLTKLEAYERAIRLLEKTYSKPRSN